MRLRLATGAAMVALTCLAAPAHAEETPATPPAESTSARATDAPPAASPAPGATEPPTGRPRLAILEKIPGKTMPAPGTFSVVITCIKEVNKVRMRSSTKCLRTTLNRSCSACDNSSFACGPLSRSTSCSRVIGALYISDTSSGRISTQ